ncbi:MAG TPA: dTDP-4-dehydrorhamnose reductase [Thermoanaerobaculia bacterium]|nr:dTDP-4-dehydrorhamnose reductase [Thermoanaerobaculia bacterium]
MRTLVLGGTGMLGQAVTLEGRRRGFPVLGLPREVADLTSPSALAGWMASFRPEVVINCAAYTKVDDCETRSEHAFAVNGEGAGNAARAAASAGAHFLQVSTDYVFDGQASEPYRPDSPVGPVSVYGASKLEGERQALAWERTAVVRTSWLFGPGGPSFVATIAGKVMRGEGPLRVVDDQVGGPTYSRFLARALFDLAAKKATGIFHYQNRGPVSWHGLATAIAEALAPGFVVQPVATAEFPRPARRPAYSVLDVSGLESLLGRRVEPWSWGLAEHLQRLLGSEI